MPTRPDLRSVMPPRSVLWGVAPEGIGTGLVSSLAGHLIRLAWDHNIPPVELLHRIADAAAEPVLGRRRADYEAMWEDLLRKPRASLSGISRTAEIVAAAIDRLTGRTDTAATTAQPWAPVIPTKSAFRSRRAYCPACYLEWGRPRPNGAGPRKIYEPLLWQFEALEVCARHAVRLRTACPDPTCRAERAALSAWAQPGYCRCGRFLGEAAAAVIARERPVPAGELAWATFVTGALGDLITHAPAPGELITPAALPAAVQLAVDRSSAGVYTPFAAAIRMSLGTVSLWKDGRRRPTIAAALRICAVAGFRLPDFLAGRLDVLRGAPLPSAVPWIPASRETHQVHDPTLVAAALSLALAADPPPPLAEVNRGLHINDRQLARQYPAECRAIVARYKAWVGERASQWAADAEALVVSAVNDVHARGDYPGRRQVQRLLPSRVSLRAEALERAWKAEVVRLGWPPPDRPRRLATRGRALRHRERHPPGTRGVTTMAARS